MLMQLQACDITLVYKKGAEMYIADALSRAYPPDITDEQFERDIAAEHFIHLMSSESYVTDRKLKSIQEEIKTNETMQLLVQQNSVRLARKQLFASNVTSSLLSI